jgi:hypothetical protein
VAPLNLEALHILRSADFRLQLWLGPAIVIIVVIGRG